MKKKNGFTLIELLAVIVVLSIVITIATTSTLSILGKVKEQTARDMEKSLQDAAISYTISELHLTKCASPFNIESESDRKEQSNCNKTITVQELKDKNYFDDKKGYCNSQAKIYVYRNDVEYVAYVEKGTCANN